MSTSISWFSTIRTMSVQFPKIKLNNGIEMPVFGLGTWQRFSGNEIEVKQAVKEAIDIGYRLFEFNNFYSNEEAVGEAIQDKIDEGVVKREDLFILTKVWYQNQEAIYVESEILKKLSLMHTTYLDMCIFHLSGPIYHEKKSCSEITEMDKGSYIEAWKSMELVYSRGAVKSIGVCNFTTQQLHKLLTNCTVFPQVYQLECHSIYNQKELREHCQNYGILLINSFLGESDNTNNRNSGDIWKNVELKKISERYGKTLTQIILKYNVQLGNIVLSLLSSKDKMLENINLFDFHLALEDMSYINSFSNNKEADRQEELETCPNYHPFIF